MPTHALQGMNFYSLVTFYLSLVLLRHFPRRIDPAPVILLTLQLIDVQESQF